MSEPARGARSCHPLPTWHATAQASTIHADVPVAEPAGATAERVAAPSRSTRPRSCSRSRTSPSTTGAFRAVRDVNLDVRQNEITAFIGPSGCGKTTVLRCLNRMNDLIATARVEGSILYHGVDLYGAERVGRRGAPPHRHGVPAAQPVPEEHLRQRRLRPADQRRAQEGRARRHRRAVAAGRGAVGRGEGPAQDVGPRACRAASSSGCASPGPSRWSPRWCSWTSRARPSTRSPPPASRS